MPNYKNTPGTPTFLRYKMNADQKKWAKKLSYDFVADWVKDGGSIESPTPLLPDFIKLLADKDDDIKRIKSHQIKTNIVFIDDLRDEIKNKIGQVKGAIRSGAIIVPKDDDLHEDLNQDHEDQDADECVDDEQHQSNHESADYANDDPDQKSVNKSDSVKSEQVPKLKAKSKKISKVNQTFDVKNFKQISLEGHQEIEYIKAIIKGKQFEVKRLMRKLKKKWNEELPISEPETPPPDKREYAKESDEQ